ncbi:hypothetical protein VP1G_06068 [Cytospora mali]|uniref:Large ribosomal subunit protein mL67 n=1 Tax=Cytospora mali TaxID=578113 RepID=A0A194V4I2_CYTMA|nr:hypothetical protein VP1G_06068 [Valsa mali var. pyri (nom. inval.)]
MNSSPASIVGILDRLSIGVSRISIRHGHTKPKVKKPQPELTGFKAGLGERIWVHNHIVTGMIVYSHQAKLERNSHKGLAQIPFTTKKQKPPVLREDYWTPLCLIELPKGLGVVGRSVMQKLQEFRRRHELEWGYQAPKMTAMSKRERGEVIHNQKSNAIADIAAVLAGAGRGNRMWAAGPLVEEAKVTEVASSQDTEATTEKEQEAAKETEGAQTSSTEGETTASKADATADSKAAPQLPKRTLVNANIYWSNDADLRWARHWTENVEHHLGLPGHVMNHRFKTKYILETPVEEVPQEVVAEEEAAGKPEKAEAAKEANVEAEQERASEKKKGWFSWVGGKSGSSSTDARV